MPLVTASCIGTAFTDSRIPVGPAGVLLVSSLIDILGILGRLIRLIIGRLCAGRLEICCI